MRLCVRKERNDRRREGESSDAKGGQHSRDLDNYITPKYNLPSDRFDRMAHRESREGGRVSKRTLKIGVVFLALLGALATAYVLTARRAVVEARGSGAPL